MHLPNPAQSLIDARNDDHYERERLMAAHQAARADAERSLAQMRAVVSSMEDGLVVADAAGNLLEWNPAALRLHGFDTLEEVQQHLSEFTRTFVLSRPDGTRLEPAEWPLARVLRGERIASEEIHVCRLDTGGEWIIAYSGAPVYGPDGRLELGLVTLHDVTAERRADAAMRRTADLLRGIAQETTDAMFVKDRNGRYLLFNRAAAGFVGKPIDEVLGRDDTTLFAPGDARLVMESDRRVMATGATETEEEELTAAGVTRVYLTTKGPHRDHHGNIIGIIGISRDITDRKRMEKRLRTQEAISRTLAESRSLREASPRILQVLCEAGDWEFGALWEADPLRGVLQCVGTWEQTISANAELTAATRELTCARGAGLPGRVWAANETVHIDEVGTDENYLRATPAGAAGFHSALGFPIRLGGQVVAVVDFLGRRPRSLDPDSVHMLDSIGNEIGQFMERARRQEEVQRFVSHSPVVIYALRQAEAGQALGQTWWVSENVLGLTGYTAEEALAPEWWVENIHPEDLNRLQAAAHLDDCGRILEYRFRKKDGSYFWIRDEKRRLPPVGDGPADIIGSWSDITQRVLLEEQLRQSQKMEAIGRLAGGIAHDFNNLLTVILGCSGLLQAALPSESRSAQLVGDISYAGERAAALTRQLLAFSRKQLLEPKRLDLNEVVSATEMMLRRLIGEDVLLETRYSPHLPPIHFDPGQLNQVVLNLALNARDAMPGGGRLMVETGSATLDEEFCRTRPELRAGEYVLLTVRDTGCGMPPHVCSRIFEPFFTTKVAGQGTGLGLATVFGILKQSDAHIEVESQVGVGTCFRIYLPAMAVPPATAEDCAASLPSRGTETILIVEDEPAVRKLAQLVLENYGYTVLEAASGAAALALVENYTGPIELLLTDVVMPGMGGGDLARNLERWYPRMPVLYMSGYTDDAVLRHGIRYEKVDFLQKPFTPDALAAKVREVLDRSAERRPT